MNILDKIIATKREEIKVAKEKISLEDLQKMPLFSRETYSLKQSFTVNNGVIAEFKRQSPSKGIINDHSEIKTVVSAYQKAGVSAVSVLTDEQYFGGSLADLVEARKHLTIPMLRKDFIVDEYQVYQAKAHGADLILLIAEALSKEEVLSLAKCANSLNLEVLFEVHSKEELVKLNDYIQHVGVNNRNLKTFEVDVQQSARILPLLDAKYSKVAESGISNTEIINELKDLGIQGFLIGENFMKTPKPEETVVEFCKTIKNVN